MLNLPGYQITELLYESDNSLVYRSYQIADEQPVVLKILKEEYPTPERIAWFKQEYELTRQLNLPGVVTANAISSFQRRWFMVLEDFGGDSLSLLRLAGNLKLMDFLKLAISISEILGQIHGQQVIHKDINPSNIVFKPATGQVKIIDFGISTLLSRENQTFQNPAVLEGNLAYISPEQTGRMNRSIDYRTDFYSLGITFYKLLTGQLPFKGKDALELVHSHIAKRPIPPRNLCSELPQVISDIVMKLMAKNAEDRYQSAYGLRADLQQCLSQIENKQLIQSFPIGDSDRIEQLMIPQKLYGRETELEILLSGFERVSQGSSEILFVSGYSGVGKSVLIDEIHKPITANQGYFIAGKCEQFNQNIPYYSFSQAFDELCKQLLSNSESLLEKLKKDILQAIGKNGQILIDIIPKLELLIGQQPQVVSVSPQDTSNRFKLAFKSFLKVICQPEHPVVLFLDDLQWSDTASLDLLGTIVNGRQIEYLLIIGAYRGNEIEAHHLLNLLKNQIDNSPIESSEIYLTNLRKNNLKALILDTFQASNISDDYLVDLIHKKTQGNAFFTIQFLKSLYTDKLLSFDASRGLWQWSMQQIETKDMTDNVVELMVDKIANLSKSTQIVLELAACIGDRFDLATLAALAPNQPQQLLSDLFPALQEGLIIPLNSNYKLLIAETHIDANKIEFKFSHDRVQEAAYSLITSTQKQANHLKIGRSKLASARANPEKLEAEIFRIVNQFNDGIALVSEEKERIKISSLNLKAGKKSKANSAYDSAVKYFRNALEFMPVNVWNKQYELMFNLYVEAIEAEYLNTNFKEAEDLSDYALGKVRSDWEKAKICQTKIQFYIAQNKMELALKTGLNVLEMLQIPLVESLPQNLNIETLKDLPLMENPTVLVAQNILVILHAPAYIANPKLLPKIVFSTVNLCLIYGNSALAPFAYAYYGLLLCGVYSDIESGYQFGQLAQRLLADFDTQEIKCKVEVLVNACIIHWREHAANSVRLLSQAANIGIETGDLEYACTAISTWHAGIFLVGESLESVYEQHAFYKQLLQSLRQEFYLNYSKIWEQTVLNLREVSELRQELIGEAFDEGKILPFLEKTQNFTSLFAFFLTKTVLSYLCKDSQQAVAHARSAAKYKQSVAGLLTFSHFPFYYSLALLAKYPNSQMQLKEDLELVETNQRQIYLWASHAPMNFQHKYDLVEAEKLRVLGQNWQAAELYEAAIKGAKKHKYIHEEAIAYERAAEFYLVVDREEIAQLYLRNAHDCYTRWGANAKVQQLEAEYPHYLLGVALQNKPTKISTTNTNTNTDGEIFDITTLIKSYQAISGEIKLEKLLQSLMQITIENAGAQTGFLILNIQGNLVIEAQGKIDSDLFTILKSIPLDTVDPKTSIPILPTTIINYVARSQEGIVLNDAVREGQFSNDPYIIANKSKSILCTPLLNQGQLRGIVYLENNLTTEVFTSERVELINILSAQAAISIDNSRLYQTLEQRVEERTKELSQTLNVLQATQKELIFENDLLRSNEQSITFDYQVGGSLSMDSPTYVVRSADRNLYEKLKQTEFCYVLNARQMGKSSLMVRMMHHLEHEGFICGAIDLTRIGSENVTSEQWYKGFTVELWRSFGLLKKVNLKTWWNERKDISPVQRLGQFIEEVLLVKAATDNSIPSSNLVVFIDEIDSVLGLNFPVDDFFALIRSCYNQRTLNKDFQRLAFVLFGVATPSDLIKNRQKTPFNIGQSIQLEDFKEHEAQPLLNGLTDKVNNPQVLLKEILAWTGGQPFLTQKLCKLIINSSTSIPPNTEAEWVEKLVQTKMIDNWESQDEPEHFKTIRDRILHNKLKPEHLLETYQQVLHQETVESRGNFAESELLLSGLIIKKQRNLKVHNRIYQLIFDSAWINNSKKAFSDDLV